MRLSNKQLARIKKTGKEYPSKSAEQIAREMNVAPAQVYRALGQTAGLWAKRLDNVCGGLTCVLLSLCPFVFIRGLNDFADLPQRALIQAVSAVLLALGVIRTAFGCRRKGPLQALLLLVPAFLVWAWMSLAWARDPYGGYLTVVHWTACGAVFFIVASLARRGVWLGRLLACIVLAGAGTIALGLAQEFFHVSWVPMATTPAAVFANANMASHYVAMVLPVIAAMCFQSENRGLQCLMGAAAVLALLFLYCTHTRASGVALAAGTVWVAMLLCARRPRALGVLLVVCLVLGAGALTGLYAGNVMMRGSGRYRLTVWSNTAHMVRERPLQGFGAGSFKNVYPRFSHRARRDQAFDKTKQVRRAHNDYLQMAAELGAVGLGLFAGVFMAGLFAAWRLAGCTDMHQSTPVIMGVSAGIMVCGVVAFFSFPFQRAVPPLLVCVYLGIIVGLSGRRFEQLHDASRALPAWAAAAACAVVICAGGAVMKLNWKNIDCDRYYHRALSMEKQGRRRGALDAGLQARRRNEHRLDVLVTVGRAYVLQGDLHKAIEVLTRVTDKQPYNLNALFILGAAYANAGDKERALVTFRRVLEIKPSFPEARKIIYALEAYGKVRVSLR